MTYSVDQNEFNGFMEAVRYAQTIDANVIEVATGLQRWSPIPKRLNKKIVRHVLVVNGKEMLMTRKNLKLAGL